MEKLEFDFVPGKNCEAWAFVGSRVTCKPAPTDTDRDVLVLSMTAVRLGDDNYIITDEREYFEKFLVMTQLAKNWNILDKGKRHELFQAAIDGRQPFCMPSDRVTVNDKPFTGVPF